MSMIRRLPYQTKTPPRFLVSGCDEGLVPKLPKAVGRPPSVSPATEGGRAMSTESVESAPRIPQLEPAGGGLHLLPILVGIMVGLYCFGPCFVFYPFYDNAEVDFNYLDLKNECQFYRQLTMYRKEIHRVLARKYADTLPINRGKYMATWVDRSDLQDVVERRMSSLVKENRLVMNALFRKAIDVNVARGVIEDGREGVRLAKKPAFVTADVFLVYDAETASELWTTALWEVVLWCVFPAVLAYGVYCAFSLIAVDHHVEQVLYDAICRTLLKEGPLPPEALYALVAVSLEPRVAKQQIADMWPSPGLPLGVIETRLREDANISYASTGSHDGLIISYLE